MMQMGDTFAGAMAGHGRCFGPRGLQCRVLGRPVKPGDDSWGWGDDSGGWVMAVVGGAMTVVGGAMTVVGGATAVGGGVTPLVVARLDRAIQYSPSPE